MPHRRDDHLKDFISWLSSNDCSHEDIDITCVDKTTNEYGLIAKKPIPEDELTLSIPKKIMMTTESALIDPCLATVASEDSLLKSMPNVLLSFHLMVEYCRKDSFWKPYILFCPSIYLTPLYYTKDDIILLKGSPALVDAVKLIRNIYRQYAYFWKKITTKNSAFSKIDSLRGLFCLDLYRWATATVMTRQNQIPVLPPSVTAPDSRFNPSNLTALIPMWDLCNHSDGKFSTDYDPSESKLLCYSMKSFAVNEEINIFYGKRTNAEFLINNGFIPVDNRYDFLSIRLGLSQVDPLYELRSRLCSKMGLQTSGYFALHHKSVGLDEDLLNYVKIFLMDKTVLDKKLLESDTCPTKSFNDLPEDLTTKAINFIAIRCQLLLKSYPTLDKEKNLSLCGQQITKLIECEKNILSSHVIVKSTTEKSE